MNSFWLGLLFLLWRMFRSAEGAAGDPINESTVSSMCYELPNTNGQPTFITTRKCPSPPAVEFAESFAESYKVGTTVKYECGKGYKRKSGKNRSIKCSSNQDGFARWTTAACIVDPTLSLPSYEPAAEEGNGSSVRLPIALQPLMKDFCGVPELLNARALQTDYIVGQKLQYQCMDGYQARLPISEKSTCQYSNGIIFWSALSLRCTNDTVSIKELSTPKTGQSDVSMDSATSYATGFATASAVFAVSMTSTVIIQ